MSWHFVNALSGLVYNKQRKLGKKDELPPWGLNLTPPPVKKTAYKSEALSRCP